MKTTITSLLILILTLSCSGQPVVRNRKGRAMKAMDPRFSPVRKKIALLEIFNESPYGGRDVGIVATEEFRRELMRTREFIVDRQAAALFGSSKEVYAGGGVKLVQLASKAKLAGVNFVLFGRIIEAKIRETSDEIGVVRKTKAFTQNKVEIRIFDVNSKKELLAQTITGYADDSTYRFFMSNNEDRLQYRQELLRYGVKVAVRKAVPKILKIAAKVDWIGRVAKIVGNRIFVNAGRQSGINIGDILKIMTEGEEVFDPETGALIGVSDGEVKGTLEIIDYFGADGTTAILHSGGSVVEGDYVKLY
jgi:hypothetical protein